MKTLFRLNAAGLLLALTLTACSPREPVIDAARITEDVRVLASDEFEGRAPATAGEQKTLDYLVAQLKAAGVEPGGDPLADGARAWTQDVPLVRSVLAAPPVVELRAGKDLLRWKQGEEIVLRAAQTGAEHVALQDLPLVFVGYGISAPERQWDDFKDIDLRGKVALILVNDPDFETGEGDFGGKAMTYYGRWMYKYEEMARRGAAGALVVHETAPAAYGWSTVVSGNAAEMFDVQRDDPAAQHVPVEGWIQRDATALLLQRAGLDYEALKRQARTRDFQPVTLNGVTLSTRFDVQRDQVVSKNVVGALRGRAHPDEWLLYTAHWDHYGIGPADATGDTIYNGAVDNAAGVAQVLEIARAFASARRTERSIAFLFVAAEERGLLGSEYYASHPLYPLATTVAGLNTDSPRPTMPARDFTTAGDAAVTLQDLFIEEGRKVDRRYTPDPRPETGMFYRSDHFPLAKRGVPAISYKSGDDLIEGGTAAGKAWLEAYDRDRYHKPADGYDPEEWRFDGITADASLLYALGRRLADSREWPEWKPGSEFREIRAASADERR